MTAADTGAGVSTPANDPFTAVAAHFGMLLGVDDLQTIVGQPWAKMRLHNAWLHGEGVVWGGGVSVDAASREVRVEAFLALDALGHELTLTSQSCLDLKAWYDANKDKVTNRGADGAIEFDAVVVAHYRACLDKPVPTLISPCDGASADTAYSRVRETAELFLLPADAGTVPTRIDRYPRLRVLRGLPSSVSAGDRAALLARAQSALADADPAAAWLRLVRDAAAADVTERHPSTHPGDDPFYDASEPAYVILARLDGLTLSSGEPVTAGVGGIELGARTSHVDTASLVELAAGGAGSSSVGTDVGGPRLVAGSAARAGDQIAFDVTTALAASTLAAGISVHRFDDAAGWVDASGGDPTIAGSTVTVTLTEGLDAAAVLRLVVSGTGPTPVVGEPAAAGALPLPFAGITGGPPGTASTGHDAELMIGGTP